MRAPSNRVVGTPTSATVLIADIAAKMPRRGQDIIDFSAVRAAEHAPAAIAQSAADALLRGDTHQAEAQSIRAEFRDDVQRIGRVAERF